MAAPERTPRRYQQAIPTRTGSPLLDNCGVSPQELASLMEAVKESAIAAATESAARLAVLDMIRRHGVTRPLLAARAMPRPLCRVQSLVLEKLEGVALYLGSP